MTCGRCHGDLALSEKFGMEADKVPAYADSYHGLASRAGSVSVASCSSCHGVHDILPSEDDLSHTNTANLNETCGQCHPGAGERFAIGAVHVLPEEPEHVAIFWVRRIYLWLIFFTIGGMLLHNALDFYRKLRHPIPRPSVQVEDAVERMSVTGRITHAMLLVSFIILVHTGFALKYPEAWWACPLPFLKGFCELRGLVHRIAAVVMILASMMHVIHLMVDRRARTLMKGMIPQLSDLRDLKGRFDYFLGRVEHPPKAEWFSYPEKMEYGGVLWGTFVMAVTGVLLWFESFTLRFLPSWTLDVATTVHFYEAILASLSIAVWHFYHVIFDPLVYPMDNAWLTGESPPVRNLERNQPRLPSEKTDDLAPAQPG